jgi:hypothetical protein
MGAVSMKNLYFGTIFLGAVLLSGFSQAADFDVSSSTAGLASAGSASGALSIGPGAALTGGVAGATANAGAGSAAIGGIAGGPLPAPIVGGIGFINGGAATATGGSVAGTASTGQAIGGTLSSGIGLSGFNTNGNLTLP